MGQIGLICILAAAAVYFAYLALHWKRMCDRAQTSKEVAAQLQAVAEAEAAKHGEHVDHVDVYLK